MSCKTLSIEILPITRYDITITVEKKPVKKYEVELVDITSHEIEEVERGETMLEYKTIPEYVLHEMDQNYFTFLYCVSYRDPNLPEWILARGIWNDDGLWTPDGIWYDQ